MFLPVRKAYEECLATVLNAPYPNDGKYPYTILFHIYIYTYIYIYIILFYFIVLYWINLEGYCNAK